MSKLDAKERKALPKSDFAAPQKRSKSGGSGGYPIPDRSHAQNALARVANKAPAIKAQVRAKVKAKYPDMGKSK